MVTIKNISGKSLFISPGYRGNARSRTRGQQVADDATANFTDTDPVVLEYLQGLAAQGLISILEGGAELDGSTTHPANGYVTLTDTGAADLDTVTIAGVVFQWGDDAATVAPNIWAGDGAVGATALATLKTAIDANSDLTGVKSGSIIDIGTDNVLPLYAVSGTDVSVGANYTLTVSGAQLTASGATLADGVKGAPSDSIELAYTVTAADVAQTKWAIPTGLASISWFQVQVLSAGAILASTAVWTVDGGLLVVDDTSVTAPMTAGDVIYLQAKA